MIYELLNKIQKELKAPKNQKNTFGGYAFRSCEDILEAVKPLLENSVLTIYDEVVMLGNRFYIKATARISLSKDDYIENVAYAREGESRKGFDESQLTGSTSSYARKYALNGLFAIDDTKDSDSTNTHGKEEKKIEQKTPAQKAQETKVENKSIFEDRFEKMYQYMKSDKVKWSYDFENRFNSVMLEASKKNYQPEKCNELLIIFNDLQKDSLPNFEQ